MKKPSRRSTPTKRCSEPAGLHSSAPSPGSIYAAGKRGGSGEWYARAYGKDGGAGPGWEGWEDQGAWPPWNEEPELPTACGGERTGWP